MEQKMTNLEATVSKLRINNSVLMANQEEMASAYKNSGVPTKISTGGGGGMSVTPGTDLAGYIGQILDERESSNSSRTTGGDKSRDTKKDDNKITWWRQFKYYCPTCGVNLTHSGKKCKSRNKKKDHDESETWDKKESPRNPSPKIKQRDRLWM